MKRAWAQVRHHRSRYGALLLAIMISVGFVTTALTFLETESSSLRKQLTAPASHADVVVDVNPSAESTELASPSPEKIESQLAGVPGVAEAVAVHGLFMEVSGAQVHAHPVVPESLRWAEMTHGTWPHAADEIAIDQTLAQERGLAVGDTVEATAFDEDARPVQLRVTGITSGTRSLLSGLSLSAFVDPAFVHAHQGATEPPLWVLQADDGVDIEKLLGDVQAELSPYGDDLRVMTAETHATEVAKSLTDGVDMFAIILLVFGAIAVLVGLLIIANTFTILIAQRRRQIGLLRAVGASTWQVRGELIGEAVLLGAIGSAFGVLLGIGLGIAATMITGSFTAGLEVPWTVGAAFLLGVLVTVVAAWVPSLRTSRIRPLEALRVAAVDQARSRPGVGTTIIAATHVMAGGGLTALAVVSDANQLVLSVAAAAALALGVLLAAGWYVPGMVRVIGALLRSAGPTARLAAANAVRNPRRTTATCLALMLAVGLVVTLQVGSASAKVSAESSIVNNYPVPLVVSTSSTGDPVPADTEDQVEAVDGVKAALPVLSSMMTIDGDERQIFGVGPGISDIVPGLSIGPHDYVVLMDYAKANGWVEGQQVTVDIAGVGEQTMTVRIHDLAGYGGAVVNADTLRSWDSEATTTAVWASVDTRDAAASRATMEAVQAIDPDFDVDGSLAYTTTLTQVLDTMVMIATGLLGAAVLIALIGVGNTLGLSVLERTRESALLRALGLQRSQLRATLALEAVFLAITAVVIGVAAGIGFGYLGTWALLSELDEPVVLSVSAPMLLIDAGIAVVAALLASVLPSRRAAMAAPTEALAEV